ncbi:hypothetical protein KKF34_12305 [Myxococcota bacterium]|nr:hypothetical protein [Myxococcota bacterium]MBU1381726.1 hypothetical protein [Myxococcota bacterium]MBU1497647.1 hypothetical protein [Myxococcota bacterium]
MKDGWYNEEYYSLAESQQEAMQLTAEYGISESLPGYFFIGLIGWDDFILSSEDGNYFRVPTVPLAHEYLKPYQFPVEKIRMEIDPRFTEKVKWYITPLIFGGSPTDEKNMAWISYSQHAQVVRWWNKKYQEMKLKDA